MTRLRSLAEAELFVAAGIPLVASVAFAEDDLAGAGYGTSRPPADHHRLRRGRAR